MPHGDMRGNMNKARVAEAVRGSIKLYVDASRRLTRFEIHSFASVSSRSEHWDN
jgi:hypothetical protein